MHLSERNASIRSDPANKRSSDNNLFACHLQRRPSKFCFRLVVADKLGPI